MPANSSQRSAVRPTGVSIARMTKYPATVNSRTSSASGLLNRNISAATGVSASRAPATRPAAGPDQRLTAAYRVATVPTPISACGASMANEENPKIRVDATITHIDAGGLSTVMELPESNDPNSQAFQDSVPAFTAAA